jgi:AcrR family transcriptional regulator
MNTKKELTSREKILEAASFIFAQKGYKNTTIREICKQTGSYQISVNYYFGSKENLFKEVLKSTYEETEEFKMAEKIKDMPPDEQLENVIRSRIRSIFRNIGIPSLSKEENSLVKHKGCQKNPDFFLSSTADKKGLFFKIVAKEFANNEILFEQIMDETLMPYFGFIKSIFSKLSDDNFDEFELNYCAYLLMSHISIFAAHDKARFIIFGNTNPDEEKLEKFILQAKKFIMAGVEKIKERKI